MRENESVKETVTRLKVKSATCDFCGKKFSKEDVDNEWFNTIDIKVSWNSKHDGFKFSGEVCDDCIDKIFAGKLRKEEVNYL